MATATFRIWRGERGQGKFQDFAAEVSGGMVVLDAVHQIQAEQAGDLAVRWNCKAGNAARARPKSMAYRN
jgi:succinate dehydrogenase / fumarate reductase, iron-sulfur subunit